LLPDNILLKVQNQALGDRNPKWKEWWKTVQEFTEEEIQDRVELVPSNNEQNYQLELEAYQNVFPDFKYEPSSLVSMEIRTSNRVPATPSMIQPIINRLVH
jgi:hypothetical protein